MNLLVFDLILVTIGGIATLGSFSSAVAYSVVHQKRKRLQEKTNETVRSTTVQNLNEVYSQLALNLAEQKKSSEQLFESLALILDSLAEQQSEQVKRINQLIEELVEQKKEVEPYKSTFQKDDQYSERQLLSSKPFDISEPVEEMAILTKTVTDDANVELVNSWKPIPRLKQLVEKIFPHQ